MNSPHGQDTLATLCLTWMRDQHWDRLSSSERPASLQDEVFAGLDVALTLLEIAGIGEDTSWATAISVAERLIASDDFRAAFRAANPPPQAEPRGDLVPDIARLVTTNSLADQQTLVDRLGLPLVTTYHQVRVRGVHAAFLHEAALQAFTAAGWHALLTTVEGTLYIAHSTAGVVPPSRAVIAEALLVALSRINVTPEVIVGKNVTESMFPKPDLFSLEQLHACLLVAGTRATTAGYLRKPIADRIANISRYQRFRPQLPRDGVEAMSQYIADAVPDIALFHFAKAVLRTLLSKQQYKHMVPPAIAAAFNDEVAAGFLSLHTYDPAKDCALLIAPLWDIIEQTEPATVRIGTLPVAERHDVLANRLVVAISNIFGQLPETERPAGITVKDMAPAFMRDLLVPGETVEWAEWAADALGKYSQSKATYGTGDRAGLCLICNDIMAQGTVARVDFLDNPEAYNQRTPAFMRGDNARAVICRTCLYERFLEQFVLGSSMRSLIMVAPRGPIGPRRAQELQSQARQLADYAQSLLDGERPRFGFSLTLTEQIAERMGRLHHQDDLGASQLAELFTYQRSETTYMSLHKEVAANLTTYYGQLLTVEFLNEEWGTAHTNVDEAVAALISGSWVEDHGAREIRDDAVRSQGLHVLARTPHALLIPMRYAFGDKENDANKGVRQLFCALLIARSLSCTTAVVGPTDTVDMAHARGVALIPRVPAVRALVDNIRHHLGLTYDGGDWVPHAMADQLLQIITAAVQLARQADLPARTGLYAALTTRPAAALLRRIEVKQPNVPIDRLTMDAVLTLTRYQ